MELTAEEIEAVWAPVEGVATRSDAAAGCVLARLRPRVGRHSGRPYSSAWMSLHRRRIGIVASGAAPTARKIRDNPELVEQYRRGEINLEVLSVKLGTATSSLRRAWRDVYGCSPTQWKLRAQVNE